MTDETRPELTEREIAWAATMAGNDAGGVILAHADTHAEAGVNPGLGREEREELEDRILAPGATRAVGAGNRAADEAADPYRTCFERDRDRILHSNAFRRLAGKTQVFIFPDDHQRTRLTHALEVAQVAGAIARATRLNVALAEAIALGHDCGHGPGGHASEDALSPYLAEGFEHAIWGAEVVVAKLNPTLEVLDGIRNHSWSRPAPMTAEGEVVSWADRIAYTCHDFEDAVSARIITPADLPEVVVDRCGRTQSSQLRTFIGAMVETIARTGKIGMDADTHEALATLRKFMYDRVYMRPASVDQSRAVTSLLQALVEFFADRPHRLPDPEVDLAEFGGDAQRAAVNFVAGMTDRYACKMAMMHLGWDRRDLPAGVGTALL